MLEIILKEEKGLDVHIVHVHEHFNDWSPMREIESFYNVLSEWSDEQKRKTILILDNFDVLLISKPKIKAFQDKFLRKMLNHIQKVSLIVTTQIETINKNFHIVRADEIDRNSSLKLLQKGHMNISDEQKNQIAEMVGDCPLALDLLIHVIDRDRSNDEIKNHIDKLIERLNKSRNEERINEELEKNYVNYTDIMQIAYDHLDSAAQCCGSCVSQYPGSFSEKLFPITVKKKGIPCNDSFFQDCISRLVQNSLMDIYTLEGVFRYKMHSLIKSFFRFAKTKSDCVKAYRFMFSKFFSESCALPRLYSRIDLEQSNKVLATDYHHFKRLLHYIKTLGSENKYEAATLVIAYQRGEITSTRDYQLLYKAVCQCEECVDYIVSSVGNEMFGKVVMNVSAKLKDFNFARCDLVTNNYCSKSLLYNLPSNFSSTHSQYYNDEVLKITCTCYLMYYYHFIGTAGILGTLPLIIFSRFQSVDRQAMKLDVVNVVFIYMSFLPSTIKLYFGSEIENIWLDVSKGEMGNTWTYSLFAQLFYETIIILFTGHLFQQREILYSSSVRIKNILMLLFLIGVPMAILQADMMGIYTLDAAKWNIGALILLMVARSCLFDYVTTKISSGILLRLFFRLVLSILSLTSEFSCGYIINTSLQVYVIFIIGSIPYVVVIAISTALLLSYLNIL